MPVTTTLSPTGNVIFPIGLHNITDYNGMVLDANDTFLVSDSIPFDVGTKPHESRYIRYEDLRTIVTSGIGGDWSNGLRLVFENGKNGWRLKGDDPEYKPDPSGGYFIDPNGYADIGMHAVDLSISIPTSATALNNYGARGDYSFAEGYQTKTGGNIATSAAPGFLYLDGNYSHAEGYQTNSVGSSGSHAEGHSTQSIGDFSHAEGFETKSGAYDDANSEVIGHASHAEGYQTTSSADYSHAEGDNTISFGTASHAEGTQTLAKGENSHAEGYQSITNANMSHAEGYHTVADGIMSHAEGNLTRAEGSASHAEGSNTRSIGENSHTEGSNTRTTGNNSHAEGSNTRTTGNNSHAEGSNTHAYNINSHAEGDGTQTFGIGSHAEGYQTRTDANYAHSEGNLTYASGLQSHSEGLSTTASGDNSHAEGYQTTASTSGSHAEGVGTVAQNEGSHAEGKYNVGTSIDTIHETGIGSDDLNRQNAFEIYTDGTMTAPESTFDKIVSRGDKALATKEYVDNSEIMGTGLELITETAGVSGWRLVGKDPINYGDIGDNAVDLSQSNIISSSNGATGDNSVAQGYNTTASGNNSHAEGQDTTASGDNSHTEGLNTNALGNNSHTEGQDTTASGNNSHAEGLNTNAPNNNQHVSGMYNIGTSTETIHETGIGVDDLNRKNAFEIYTDGRLVAPELTTVLINTTQSLTTKEYVDYIVGTAGLWENNGSTLHPKVVTDSISIGTDTAVDTLTVSGGAIAIDELDADAIHSSDYSKIYSKKVILPDNDPNTVLLIHSNSVDQNTDFVDSSLSLHSVTAVDDTHHSDTEKKFGTTSIYFDGVGDYLTIPDSEDWNFGYGEFTIDMWVKRDRSLTTEIVYGQSRSTGSGTSQSITLGFDNTDHAYLTSWYGNTATVVTSSNTISDNNWHHIAAVRDVDTLRLFVDGVLVGTGNVAGKYANNSTYPLSIGANGQQGYLFQGYIDEVHVSKGIARWTTSFSPPTQSYTNTIANLYYYNSSSIITRINLWKDSGTDISYIEGNVGIGTNTPNTTLDVDGSGNFTDTLTIGAYTLPVTDGTSGQALLTNGAGLLSFSDVSLSSPTGLERITEDAKDGWRMIGRNAPDYGNIGSEAIDMSFSASTSTTKGATGNWSFASGYDVTASGIVSHAEGRGTTASGENAHAEGQTTTASALAAHAEGLDTIASGFNSHAEGRETTASEQNGSHAEGYQTTASAQSAHAEGWGTTASGNQSHSQGYNSTAIGVNSHAEGNNTTSSGDNSHAEGYYTTAPNDNQHVSGIYNVGTDPNTILEVGIGIDDLTKKNAFEIYTNGSLIAPELTTTIITSGSDKILVTREYIDSLHGSFADPLPGYGESGGEVIASNIDTADGNVWYKTITANTTFTFTNAFDHTGFSLILTNAGSYTITWPSSVKWPGGLAPILTGIGVDVITFTTPDTGVTWYGMFQTDFS